MTALCRPICEDRVLCLPECALPTDQDVIDMAWTAAEQIFHELTGRKWGYCTETIEYCTGCECGCNLCKCDPCDRIQLHVFDRPRLRCVTDAWWVPLPTPCEPHPIENLTHIPINGLTVRDWNYITFPPGYQMPEGATVRITYDYGIPFPKGACAAVAEIAEQLISAMCNGCECKLPANVVNFIRGDVSYAFSSPETLIKYGLVGLPLTDLFIKTWGRYKRPKIFSPDVRYMSCGRWYRVTDDCDNPELPHNVD